MSAEKKKLRIAYYCSNRTVFPPPKDIIAANADVMKDIAQGMMKKGHEVTIYAAKGSSLDGAKIEDLGMPPHKLDMAYPKEGQEKRGWISGVADVHNAYRVTYISELVANSDQYDIIHLHVGRSIFGAPFIKFSKCPIVFTLHDEQVEIFHPLMKFFGDKFNLISISNSQRKTLPDLNYIATVYNGTDVKNITFDPNGGKKFLFLSRVSKEKGLETAIAAAKKAGVGLDIYGPAEKKYFENDIKPLLDDKIQYKGIVGKFSSEWSKAFSSAKALLFPIQWEEPFGLAMTESLSHGTPVITFNRGAVPEVLKDEKTGFICKENTIDSMAEAIAKINDMSEEDYKNMRSSCRKHVEDNFSVEKMVDGYEEIYYKVINK